MKTRLIRSAAVVVVGAITFFAPLLLAHHARGESGHSVRAQSASTYADRTPSRSGRHRVLGTALFKTAIDISNNNANSVTARYQYSYNGSPLPAGSSAPPFRRSASAFRQLSQR